MSGDPKPIVAQKAPYIIEMEPGTYLWCACGRSKNQPLCDGSHEGTGIAPIELVIEERRKVAWCGCKMSRKGCLCDGTHKRI